MVLVWLLLIMLVAQGSSGTDCPENSINCGNGKCVGEIWRCDGENDCGNFKDEQNCGTDCPENSINCGNGKCVGEIWRCDGENDCGNFKDEQNCEESLPEEKCLSSQYQCLEDGHCIPEAWVCNGERDCTGGSDEDSCENNTHCHGFKCRDNHCVPSSWKCDGRKDCLDGLDEEFCSKDVCDATEFTCSSGTCLDRRRVCDNKNDCLDGSDEGRLCSQLCNTTLPACSQNCRQTPKGPECYCNEGFRLGKDGKTCEDVDECLVEGFCSQQCTNLIGGYKCSCLEGYQTINNTCQASGPEPILVFSTLQEIRAMFLRTKRYFPVHSAITKAASVDVDPVESRVYWVEISNKSTVYSSKLDGSGFSTVLTNGLMVPEGIAIDYVARNLYFTDSGLKQILACKMDGSMYHVLHSTNIDRPRAIAVDPPEGLLYWSDWGESTSGIYRSGMDGSRRTAMVSKDIKWPNGIAIDHASSRLYWSDAKLSTIEYITLDGKTRNVLMKNEVNHPYSLAVFEDNLYWSDWTTFTLETSNKFTGHNTTVMVREDGKHIMGVHVYHPVLARRANNPCWGTSCSHLCLIAPLNTYRCACPPGFTLGRNGRTCTVGGSFHSPRLYLLEVHPEKTTQKCPNDDFNCSNGRCILSSSKCDGTDDCGDNSDEINCPIQKCPIDDFKCSNGRCILSSSKCDGTDDCGDNSDEIGCPCEGFTCPVSGECISWSRVCDGDHDCADLMDEGPLCASSCNGSCVHKCQKTPQGPKCSCHDGYVLSDDGVSCYDECDTPSRCSHFCNRTKKGFKCSCAEGYVLDSDLRTCKADDGETFLAYLVKDEIRGLSLETHSGRMYVRGNFSSVIGISYYAAERAFFWADRKEKTINSYSVDSDQFEVLMETQQEPQLLRRDWVTKNVYYTTDEGSVVCCEGNGQYCTSVIKNISSRISGFDISPAFGFIFWSVSRHRDLDSVSGVIERANMDGSFRQVVVSDHIFLITAIAVDPVLEAIYWSDSGLGTIESTDFNGVQRRKVVDHLQYPISITVFEDSIYWVDRATNSLSRCDKFSGKDRETLISETTPFNSLLITHKAAQMQEENHCSGNNCLHICLPTRASFVCRCDDRHLTGAASCELESSSVNQSCPVDYCPGNTTCVFDGHRFVCKCLPNSSGERCGVSLQHPGHSPSEPHPVWIVCAVLVVVCVCLLATSLVFYRTNRKSTQVFFGSKAQYVNTALIQGSCGAVETVGRHENEYEAVVVM